jgi:23S rRNA (pseudouridine1915-N3)-methyltransferase
MSKACRGPSVKIAIHAIGRMKTGPERELVARYMDRCQKTGRQMGLDFQPVSEAAESPASSVAERQRDEAERLRSFLHADAALFLLDERGEDLTSPEFAARLGSLRDEGCRTAVFAIGGPDGHDPALRREAKALLSFGALTWPHQLVRILLAEQLYRATTILSGHPYHRA